MTNDDANLINKRRATKNRTLFWASMIATVFQVSWLTLEMFGYQAVLFEMTAIYLLILVIQTCMKENADILVLLSWYMGVVYRLVVML